ncbi:T3SS (YopN, CesT) and YbjN peptide-binding chaperone 1 [Janibacter anophelis]|uniref:T3SS (YopN, CesT) and YbjN peptide-binding chaperone 1 n=1 Tax=Janibacter anophelis TaxID=319054 RepID=UPI000DEF42AD|nr:YbjN domain-containing protein [Janibacter anophelis]
MSDPTALPNFGPTPPNGGDQPAPEAPLRDRVQDALRELGLEPSIDSEGDVAFTFSEQQMFIRCQDDESNVLRVFGQWALEDPVPTDPMERLQVSNDLNVAFNLVKAAVAGDTLLVTSEHILPRGADVRGLLGLALPLVLQGVQLWHQRATGQDPTEESSADAPSEPQA